MMNTEKDFWLDTPRGRLFIKDKFKSAKEAENHNYGYWFSLNDHTHIYGKTNPANWHSDFVLVTE